MLVHHTFDSGFVVLSELSPLVRTGDVPGASLSQMHLGYLWLRELRVSEGAALLQADERSIANLTTKSTTPSMRCCRCIDR